MKKRIIVAIFVLSIIILTTACQATPEEPVVINKTNNSVIMQEQKAPVEEQKYEVTQEWKTSFKAVDENITITVDATVEEPHATSFPIIEAKPKELMEVDAEKYIKGSFGEATLYQPKTEADWSKEDIEAEIIRLKKGDSDFADADPEGYQASIQDELKALEKKYAQAPDTYTPKTATIKFEQSEMRELVLPENPTEMQLKKYKSEKEWMEAYRTIKVEADLGKESMAYFEMCKTDVWNCYAYFYNIGDHEQRPGGRVLPIYNNPTGLTLSVEEAKNIALQQASALGMQDYQVVAVGILPSGDVPEIEYTYESLYKCYEFYLTKKICDVPITYVSNAKQGGGYVPRWLDDTLFIAVDDSGVLEWCYRGSTEVGEVVNENVELLPFDQIKERFETQMKINEINQEEGIIKKEITIDYVKLGMCRIAAGENYDSFRYVPVWDFFGKTITQYDESIQDANFDENNAIEEVNFGLSYLTINAIDGSIIDRSLGY